MHFPRQIAKICKIRTNDVAALLRIRTGVPDHDGVFLFLVQVFLSFSSALQGRISAVAAKRGETAEQRKAADTELAELGARLEAKQAALAAAASAATARKAQETARRKEVQGLLQRAEKDLRASRQREAKLAKQLAKNRADVANAELTKQEMAAADRK